MVYTMTPSLRSAIGDRARLVIETIGVPRVLTCANAATHSTLKNTTPKTRGEQRTVEYREHIDPICGHVSLNSTDGAQRLGYGRCVYEFYGHLYGLS